MSILLLMTVAAVATCPVADEPVVAEVTLDDGRVARVRPGALQLDGRTVTACDGLPDAFPTALAAFGAGVAVGFRGAGVQIYDGKSFTPVPGVPAGPVRALAAVGSTLYVGGARGLWRVAGGTAVRIGQLREITALSVRADGVLDIGAGTAGWWRLGSAGRLTRVEKDVFVGCFRAGGPRPPGPGCAPESPSISGLPSGHVTALAMHQGRLFVGTFDHGLAREVGDGRFAAVAGAPRFVNALVSSGDTLWIASAGGLYRLDGEVVSPVPLGLRREHVNALLAARDGTLWLATSSGLVGLSPDGLRTMSEPEGLPSRLVYAVAQTADGAIWAGTANGLARVSKAGVRVFTRASGALPHDWVTALLTDADGLLVGTYAAGVVRIGADGRSTRIAGLEKLWVNPGGLARVGGQLAVSTLGDGLVLGGRVFAGLPSNDVTAVVEREGRLVVGTAGGLLLAR